MATGAWEGVGVVRADVPEEMTASRRAMGLPEEGLLLSLQPASRAQASAAIDEKLITVCSRPMR